MTPEELQALADAGRIALVAGVVYFTDDPAYDKALRELESGYAEDKAITRRDR